MSQFYSASLAPNAPDSQIWNTKVRVAAASPVLLELRPLNAMVLERDALAIVPPPPQAPTREPLVLGLLEFEDTVDDKPFGCLELDHRLYEVASPDLCEDSGEKESELSSPFSPPRGARFTLCSLLCVTSGTTSTTCSGDGNSPISSSSGNSSAGNSCA